MLWFRVDTTRESLNEEKSLLEKLRLILKSNGEDSSNPAGTLSERCAGTRGCVEVIAEDRAPGVILHVAEWREYAGKSAFRGSTGDDDVVARYTNVWCETRRAGTEHTGRRTGAQAECSRGRVIFPEEQALALVGRGRHRDRDGSGTSR